MYQLSGDLKAILNGTKPDATPMDRYAASKLAHAISATMWKRKLKGQADVIAVSPGFVPTTALNRDGPWHQRWFMQHVLSWAPFATSLHDGQYRERGDSLRIIAGEKSR